MRFQCPFCDRGTFSFYEDLSTHVRECHSSTPVCPACSQPIAGEPICVHAKRMAKGAPPGDLHRILHGLTFAVPYRLRFLPRGELRLLDQCCREAFQACGAAAGMINGLPAGCQGRRNS